MSELSGPTAPPGMAEPPTGDPWIDAYLRFRAAVLDDEFTTFAEVDAYAREAQRGLPSAKPSIPAAMFITADMAITFPETFPALMAALWTPSWLT